ncbi:SAM-dependent methyltransferase [Salinactinospora qingdaonensis]|uniref:SAM-dependent methyltransferase n=2 Tax=Salinactinospora qingdaonensis TaxID=702744 RepID=A0ABP7GMU4_9ACTN
MYDYDLGGKDNFAVDREAVLNGLTQFPETLDAARQNRLFLYRVVRFLAREAGIDQFLDLGSGLPTQHNVHQVAQRFQHGAHVVYVDNDPIVLAHGRALLADNDATMVITADMTEPREILARPDVAQLIDFTRPVAALFLSVPHSIPDDDTLRDTLSTVTRALTPGSFLGLSQMVGEDEKAAQGHTEAAVGLGLAWKTRTVAEFTALVAGLGLEPVEPGLVDVNDWRPDPDQPPLDPVAPPLQRFLGAGANNKRVKEVGGVLRKP